MKRTSRQARPVSPPDELLPEYRMDYTRAKPNRFAGRSGDRVVVILDPDVAAVFSTPDSVNTALRALIGAMPNR